MRIRVLVASASRYGSTQTIAERIAKTLREQGLAVETQRAGGVSDASAYDAFVVGSAVYYGSWLKEAAEFVRQSSAVLANRPVWLFSSGPISAGTTDAQDSELRVVAEPKQIADFKTTVNPQDHRVFFGKLDRSKLRLVDRLVAKMPAFPGSEGDFRDWKDIEAWTTGIAAHLETLDPTSESSRSPAC